MSGAVEALKAIRSKHDGSGFKDLDRKLFCDRDFVRAFCAIKYSYPYWAAEAMPHVSHALRADKAFMMELISLHPAQSLDARNFVNGCLLEYASDALRDDKDVARCAIEHQANSPEYGGAYQHLSAALKKDRELAILAVKRCGSYFNLVDESLHDDEAVVRAALVSEYTHGWGASSIYRKASARIRAMPEILEAFTDADIYTIVYDEHLPAGAASREALLAKRPDLNERLESAYYQMRRDGC